jgi:hypothetical protein
MRKLILLPCLALLTAAASANSAPNVTQQIAPTDNQQVAQANAGGSKPAPAAEEKKVCKQLDTTGSRLPKRACLTAKEWKQVEADLDH